MVCAPLSPALGSLRFGYRAGRQAVPVQPRTHHFASAAPAFGGARKSPCPASMPGWLPFPSQSRPLPIRDRQLLQDPCLTQQAAALRQALFSIMWMSMSTQDSHRWGRLTDCCWLQSVDEPTDMPGE